MHKMSLLTAAALVAFASPALAADETSAESTVKVKQDADGNYEKKTSVNHKDAAGTKTTEDTKVKVNVNDDGTASRTVETETTRDPKGLLNKSTVKSTDKYERDADGKITHSHKKKVDGETVEDTSTETR